MPTLSETPSAELTLENWDREAVEKKLANLPLLLLVKRAPPVDDYEQRRIILFIHGLNSSARTWIPMLSAAYETPELRSYDFGLFTYETALFTRLRFFRRAPRAEDWARVLANAIQTSVLEQERYDSFVLVAHSMGGLISKFAIRYLLETNRAAVSHLSCMFTYGTPNQGSDRAGAISAVFSQDLKFLRAFSSPLEDLQTFWNSKISPEPGPPGKLTIHERAIVSIKDRWVAPASGISALPEKFVRRIASTHGGLIVPDGPADQRLRWFVDQLAAIQRQSACSLIEIRNGWEGEDFLGDDDEIGTTLVSKLFDATLVLDVGASDGVAKGDYFALFHESTAVRDADGRVIDRIPGSMSTVRAIDVKDRVTYCRLKSFAYQQGMQNVSAMVEDLSDQGVEEVDSEVIARLMLSLFGRRAVRIPRAESDAAALVSDIYDRTLDPDLDEPSREKELLRLLNASREFLDKNRFSLMADNMAYREAWSSKELGRYDDARLQFEKFLERYPFSPSVSGARRAIEEIGYRRAWQKSEHSPESQLKLAAFLVKEGIDVEKSAALALDAFYAKPGLLQAIPFQLRFVLTARYVWHEVLGQSLESPEAMGDMLIKYRDDAAFREETRQVVEKGAPERAALLLQLLESTSKDWKVPADPPA